MWSRRGWRVWANRLFVSHPRLGQWGYDALRVTRLSRSARGVTPFLKALRARGFRPQAILDVGANYGEWSRLAQGVFPQARFYLIEPQVEMMPFLDNFCATAPGSRRFLAGAAAQSGTRALTLWEDYQGSSFGPAESAEFLQQDRQRLLPVIAVDDLIAQGQMPIPDLVKIDVQGLELDVLQGATRCLGQSELFVLEASWLTAPGETTFTTLLNFMEAHGYALYDFLDFKRRPYDGALAQADVAFARQDGWLRREQRWD